MTGLAQYVDALTVDGAIVRLRPASPRDVSALVDLYTRASPTNLRLRFFHVPSAASIDAEAQRLCRPATPGHCTVVAELADVVVGVASYERRGRRHAEFAVFVDDRHHGRGIGTLLLEQLVADAHRHGVVELSGDVLGGNTPMLTVARDLAGGGRTTVDAGVVTVTVPTGDGVPQELVDRREARAERASLRPMLAPASVAVVGAGRHSGVGHQTLVALAEYGFRGALYAVNPHVASVAGHPAYPSLSAIPGGVELAVIAVPATAVADVVADGATAGVRAAVVLSAGFADDGPDGRARQAALVDLARRHSMRLVGPNCLGVANTDPDVRLNAGFGPSEPGFGRLGIASQSGAVGIALVEGATRTGVGVSSFVSLGNKADVSGNDLLAYWLDDPATDAVALYLESFGNPGKFARLVRAVARRKPVLVLKSGRSTAGRRAGASHTAAAAAPDRLVDALFEQAGVVRVGTLDGLLDAARQLTGQPLPTGNRIAVVGNAGGLNILAADAAEAAGLEVPANAAAGNPLDLGAGATAAACAEAIRAAAADTTVDAVLVILVATRANDVAALLAEAGAALDDHPALAAGVVVVGDRTTPLTCGTRHVPVFATPERAVVALGHAARYAVWRRRPVGHRPVLPGVDRTAARRAVAAGIAAGGSWQPHERAVTILRAYGIRVTHTAAVLDPDDAVAASNRLGYPVAVKCGDPELVHKTDRGAVGLGLTGPGAVRAAAVRVAAAGRPGQPVLVQRMTPAAVELAAGIVHDARFGSLVMAGMGGIRADVLDDRAFRLVPVTDLDAGRMWRSLHGAELLTGFRGGPPVDTRGVEDLLLRLGRLAEDLPEVAELDLNPVAAGPDGVVALDAKLRLHAPTAEIDPLVRALTAC
jgi:acyl-CoA synthetase (NDP forming)/GNAT superfamily N-acetyltransferase